ncbi:MAG: ATP-binding protein [Chromatiaceae bacterium]|jgi:sigma-B regulation protein RsbU (phosphoserine phosphatase)|nr:ATP-binding protein [Chromatiaceae bacterium]
MERWLADRFHAWDLPDRTAFAVDLVINEALTNLISYAYSDAEPHEIVLTLTDSAETVTVEIVDDAHPFNPFEARAAAAAPDLEHASIGGRGLLLIQAYSHDYHYSRVTDRNRLTLVVRKDHGG